MLAQALAGLPEEVCGLLGGIDGRAYTRRALRNVATTPHVRYEIDPAEQIAVMLEFEASGWELVGVYHSHPLGPAQPSATDIAESYYPDVVYFIISLADPAAPQITAWQIVAGEVYPVHWSTVPDDTDKTADPLAV